MKKLFFCLLSLILFTFPCFSEMSFGLGYGIRPIGFENLKTDELSLKSINIVPITIPLQFSYFYTKDSKIGFFIYTGITASMIKVFISADYSGTENYHIINDSDYYPVKDYRNNYYHGETELYPSFSFLISPNFAYRTSYWTFGVGPAYSISFSRILFANESDKIPFSDGSYGYKDGNFEFITHQNVGINFTAKRKIMGVKIGLDFLENSKFTDNSWTNCFNINFTVFGRYDWKFNTYRDKKIEKQQAELLAVQQEEKRIKAEKEAEKNRLLEEAAKKERQEKEQEKKRQAEILAEQKRKENEIIQQKKKQNAEKILSSFTYDKLPLGKDMNYVLSLCDGSDITENNETDVYFIKDYGLSLLSGSTYSRALTGLGCYLLSECTKSYTIENEHWENLNSMTLIFTKSYKNNDYTLMMIIKNQKRTDDLSAGKYESVFSAMKNAIMKQIGTTATQFEESYTNEYFRKCYALCARWQPNGRNIYLFVDNSSIFSESSRGPIIVYVDNAQCTKYMNAEKAFSAEQQRKNEQNVQIEF